MFDLLKCLIYFFEGGGRVDNGDKKMFWTWVSQVFVLRSAHAVELNAVALVNSKLLSSKILT